MNDYLELVYSGLSASIGYAVVGLLAGGIIVFLLHRAGYLKRENLIWRLIARLHYVLFPVVFCLYFWLAGSLWTTVSVFRDTLEEVIAHIEKEQYPIFASYVNQQIKESTNLDDLPSNNEIASQFLSDNEVEGESNFYQYTLKLALVKILDLTIGDGSDREKRIEALSNGISTEIFEAGFNILRDELNRQLSMFLWLLLIPGTIVFMGYLLYSFFEIGIYYIINKNKEIENK